MTTDTLVPCPFCGGEAQLSDGECGIRGMPVNWRNPRCTRCGCDLGYTHHLDAVERWNRRTTPRAAAGELPEAAEVVDLQASFPACAVVPAMPVGTKLYTAAGLDALEAGRRDAELGRYVRLTADQRKRGLSEHAFWIRIEQAIERRAAIDATMEKANG